VSIVLPVCLKVRDSEYPRGSLSTSSDDGAEGQGRIVCSLRIKSLPEIRGSGFS